MFFWECGMETQLSVKYSMCGEECFLGKRELCLLYIELFMLSYQLFTSKFDIQKLLHKRKLRNFACVIYAFIFA